MEPKNVGMQLAHDVITMATRHHIISELIAERLYEDFDSTQILALDKNAIIEGAMAEFREVFVEELEEVLANAADEE